MTRRTERVGNLLRNTIADVIMRRLSDPRINPAVISITRVEVTEDLMEAKVFVSIMGDEAEQRTALRALQHAAGHIQDLVRKEVSLRHTPVLDFRADEQFKKTMETLSIIQQAMDEIHQKEEAIQADASAADPAAETETTS
ncbi:MAG: 30S ribosome-binding factor RbfA [Planctomycetota bacterium]|jgi:ribosome-binding factor A